MNAIIEQHTQLMQHQIDNTMSDTIVSLITTLNEVLQASSPEAKERAEAQLNTFNPLPYGHVLSLLLGGVKN